MADVALSPRTVPAPQGDAFRRYPPLVTLVVALLIAFLILPSALNLPQSSPSTVLELAPVPPEDDTPPPADMGSLSALNLGVSSNLPTDSQPPPAVGPRQGGSGERPQQKRCVGDPPRQTEDPNSPPCVAFFDAENGGATWQGVTRDEITVLIYVSAHLTTGGTATPPSGTYCDVDGPRDTQTSCLEGRRRAEDHLEVRTARALSKYFNQRFMTYDRHVHFWVYWTASDASPASRRADAQQNWESLKPFAVIDRAFFGGFNAAYASAMTRLLVSVYGNFSTLPNRYFRNHAPYIWSFWPDVERMVDMYVSYVCERVAPFPTSFAGSPGMNGRPRTYAYLWANDKQYESLKIFADQAKERFRQPCPGNGIVVDESVAADLSFPRHQFRTDTHPQANESARRNIATMQQEDVTTVLWLQGFETEHSKAAFEAGYLPEWVLSGDLLNDGISNARFQNQQVWRHAWVASNTIREDRQADAPCRQAYREAEPHGANADESNACVVYRAFFMLFRGIQSAGPYLSPESVDQGNHAIPRQSSTTPLTAACFFDPNDYTCVKDAQESWWDPDAPDPNGSASERGCWRMVDGGTRYLAGEWPPGQGAFQNRQDPCNSVDSNTFINPYGPAG